MIKFIKTILIYLLAILIIIVSLNHFYVKKYDIRLADDTNKFNNIPNNINICNFGSSHSQYGVNYEKLSRNYTCFNFALSDQSLTYDAILLSNYKNKIAKNAIVFITVSYFSILGPDETKRVNFQQKNMRYYDFLPHNSIKNYNLSAHIFRVLPVLTAYHNLPYVLLASPPPITTVETLWNNSAENIDINENANNTFIRHFTKQNCDADNNIIINNTEINAIYKIIELCRSINATPILITTPYLAEYNELIQENFPDFQEKFFNIVNEISVLTGTPYFDYSNDMRFIHSYNLFRDCDHLNRIGALYFTDILKEEIIDNYAKR